MRKRERKLVITFHTTADAMAMEQICKQQQTPGRSDTGSKNDFCRVRAGLVCRCETHREYRGKNCAP